MTPTPVRRDYWRKNLRLTSILLCIWFIFTFVTSGFARELNAISFFGFPLGFYMSAQGSVIIYVGIIWIYARCMNRLDARYVDRSEHPPRAKDEVMFL